MEFLKLERSAFDYGVAQVIAPNVRRVIAENPSKFTYHGTGTYIIGTGDVTVIDPGPQLDSHRDALHAALTGSSVRAILVTHCHADHSPLAAWLTAETGAPTVGFGPHGEDLWDIGDDPLELEAPASDESEPTAPESTTPAIVEESTDRAFVPEIVVTTGDAVASGAGWVMTALHTPGHTSNHLCFALDDGTARTLFTGDHVMGWSTTVVSPPDGDMAAYFESLRVVAGRNDDLLIPTHGSPIDHPREFVDGLIAHRVDRESQVLAAVRGGLDSIATIVKALYVDVRPELHKPAGRSVLAHLVKLVDDGVVVVSPDGPPRLDSRFAAV